MKLLKKERIGTHADIMIVENKSSWSVSLCILDLSLPYNNQLYANFNSREEAEEFYNSIRKLQEQA